MIVVTMRMMIVGEQEGELLVLMVLIMVMTIVIRIMVIRIIIIQQPK